MPEAIHLLPEVEGEALDLTRLDPDGLIVDDETSAWPRRTSIRLDPLPGTTEKAVKRVLQRLNRTEEELPLQVERIGDALRISGIDPKALPPGAYDFRFAIYGLRPPDGMQRIEIPKGRTLIRRVPLKRDPRRISVALEPEWDRQIKELLQRSQLDGQAANTWVSDPLPRARRRACLMNILAVCRELDLLAGLQEVFFCEVDRIYTQTKAGFAARLGDRFRGGKPPGADIHERILDWLELSKNDYQLLSYRQVRNPSLQVVTATPKSGSGRHYAELDIDAGSIHDPVGIFIHIGELLNPGRTDHFEIGRKLRRLPARPFLIWEEVDFKSLPEPLRRLQQAVYGSRSGGKDPLDYLGRRFRQAADQPEEFYLQPPRGDTDGSVMFAGIPGKSIRRLLALNKLAMGVWTGKFFEEPLPNGRIPLANKVFGRRLIRAEAFAGRLADELRRSGYPQDGALDDRSSLVLDYTPSEFRTARTIRDEIRQIEPGLYLGRATLKGQFLVYFALHQGG